MQKANISLIRHNANIFMDDGAAAPAAVYIYIFRDISSRSGMRCGPDGIAKQKWKLILRTAVGSNSFVVEKILECFQFLLMHFVLLEYMIWKHREFVKNILIDTFWQQD